MSPAPFQVPEIRALTELLPAFEFEHLIAQGGSGAVYKARQPALGRDVAIKILPRELSDDPFHGCSFLAEAKAMASLSHPNLIRVYDSGEVAGMHYMVMEYVPGNSLFKSAHGKAIDSKQAARIVLSACRGLAHAHANGIVHGDIRPANILLNAECEPKIGSFASSSYSPAYLAPEVAHDPEAADAGSDVYAMGVLLRELLTGIPPGSKPDDAAAAITDPRLATICREATHNDPASRCPDANALASRLEECLSAGSSRLLTTAPQTASHRPKTILKRPAPTAMPHREPSPVWAIAKNCAVIAILLCTIHILWGAYQTKKETIARLQREEDAKPKVVKVVRMGSKSPASPTSHISHVAAESSLLVRNLE
jgi:serine/threonine protein kinase